MANVSYAKNECSSSHCLPSWSCSLFRDFAQCGKNMIARGRPTFVSWSWSWTANLLFDSVWLCWSFLSRDRVTLQVSESGALRKNDLMVTLVSNFSSRIVIDSRFLMTQNLSWSCGNSTREILEGLHADRVYRSYFELEVSLLVNGEKQSLLKHHMLCYYWTDYYTILANRDAPDSLVDRSRVFGESLPSPELSNHS